jgi:RNA polymerase primary sigma factor
MGEEARSAISTSFEKYLSEISEFPLISVDEEKKLAEKIKTGDTKAVEELVHANLRLVIHIAKSYQPFGVPVLDLISEGNIGLYMAALRFNPVEFEAKFSTYASWWVRQRIQRHITNVSGAMRVPVHVWDKLRKIKKFMGEYVSENHEFPSHEEISFATGFKVEHVKKYLATMVEPVSLNASLSEDGDTTFESVVEDQNAVDPHDNTMENEENKTLKTIINELDERSREVILRRYGLNGSAPETLEQVATTYGVTRERIRQIEAKAIKRMRFLMRRLNKDERLRIVML